MDIKAFNTYNIQNMSENEIMVAIDKLFTAAYEGDLAETPNGIRHNAELLANILPYYIEMNGRLTKRYMLIKSENEAQEEIDVYRIRDQWVVEHPTEKAPSITYFQGKAKLQENIREQRQREFESYSQLQRFKQNINAIVEEINVLKKKIESFKYE